MEEQYVTENGNSTNPSREEVHSADRYKARTRLSPSRHSGKAGDTEIRAAYSGEGSLDDARSTEAGTHTSAQCNGRRVHPRPEGEVSMSTTTPQNAGLALENNQAGKKEAIRLRRRPRRFRPTQLADVSSAMKLAGQVRELPEIRWDLVNEVRAEIEAGTYETPERIDATVEILLEELLGTK